MKKVATYRILTVSFLMFVNALSPLCFSSSQRCDVSTVCVERYGTHKGSCDLESTPQEERAASVPSHLSAKQSLQSVERTLALIKPEIVASPGKTGTLLSVIELNGFSLVNITKLHLNQKQAAAFYGEHAGKPFFKELITYITSGPLVALVLEKENAIKDWRKLMGATDPQKAELGTMRRMFGADKTHNAVHGSDSPQAAAREVKFFFSDLT